MERALGYPEGPPAFDRTYEGLKRRGQALLRVRTREAFDRTYEGLKPGRVGLARSAGDPPFDRTYEGLKLRGVREHVQRHRALLTVPMRV